MVGTDEKNRWLLAAAEALGTRSSEILEANAKDVAAAAGFGLNAAAIDRLTLTPSRIRSAADGLRQVAALPDPIGEIRETTVRPNGLRVEKIGVPLGVVFFIYESRPNVTVDAAGLCVKSGNAVILRGGKEAIHSQPCGIDRHVRPRFEDEEDDAERDAHFLHVQAVRSDAALANFADGIGQSRHLSKAFGRGLDARRRQCEPVDR